MAEFREDTDIYPVMLALATEAQAEVERSGLPPVGFTSVQPGTDAVLDHVGNGKECSEILVNMTNAYPVNGFPQPALLACGTEMAYDVQVGTFRCAPAPTGNPPRMPSVADQVNATRLHLADMQSAKRAICKVLNGKREYIIRSFLPYGPSGLVVGGVWLITISGTEL